MRLKDHEKSLLISLCQISKEINSSLDTNEVLSRILNTSLKVMGGERGFILLMNSAGELEVAVEKMMGKEQLEGEESSFSKSAVDRVKSTLEPVVSSNAPLDFNKSQSIKVMGIRSILCSPIKEENKLLGIIYIDTLVVHGIFSEEDKDTIVALANQAAVAIKNASLYKDLEESYFDAVRCLANTIAAKDPYTKGHCERVAYYSVRCGKELGLTKKELYELEIAALVHDIGKLGVREEVLLKPGKLTPEEKKEIEEHSQIGYDIVVPLKLPERVKLSILHHQERFDGKGYPDGLKGEEIPFFSRIIAVADTFDAMTSGRAYRTAFPIQTAVDEIAKCSDTQFDPVVVKAFLYVVEKEISA